MTTHVRFEQLAAAAIDFDLTRAEREQLNEHLAGCPACRATAGAYRRDAHAMREIAFVPAPAAVRAAVLGAATRSAPRVVAPWRLVAAAALLAAALVGALVAVGAWNARPTLVQTVPAPSPRGVSTPVPTLDAALPSPAPSSPVVAAQVGATCDGSLAAIAAPTVQAQVDGVHLLVENTSGQPLDFGIEDGTGLALQGNSVPGASGAYTYDLAPGTYRFACNTSIVPFTVVDPGAHYVSPQLSCATPGSGTTGTTDFAPGARGPAGPVLDVVRQQLRGIEPSDVVELAGYLPANSDRLVRVVRDGQVIAVVGATADGHDGWLIGAPRACPDSGITKRKGS